MLGQGISWGVAVGAAAIGAGMVTALFFLKTRHQERRVPSLMLWREVLPMARRTRLWGRFCRVAHWLLLVAAVAALAAALTAPVWPYREVPEVVIVAEPAALPEARKIAAAGTSGRTSLLVADSGPVFRSPASAFGVAWGRPSQSPASGVNRSEALWLARRKLAGGPGRILYCGNRPPPWLPSNGSWVQTVASSSPPEVKAVRVYWTNGAPPEVIPGFAVADSPAEAEVVVEAGGWAELMAALKERRGGDGDFWQQALKVSALAPEEVRLPSGWLAAANGLWALGLLMLALDLGLWMGRKVV